MKFIQFDASGALLTRFDSDLHGDGIPADAVAVSDHLFFQTIHEADGIWVWNADSGEISKIPLPTPSVEQVLASLLDAARFHMDQRAADAGFRDISDAVSYADEQAVPSLQAEARALRAWRSVVMERWRDASANVHAGGSAPDLEDFIQSLPEVLVG